MNRQFRRPRWVTTVFGLAVVLALGLALVLDLVQEQPADTALPGVPSSAEAARMLTELTVAPEGSTSGYSREMFPHWTTASGTCNTREEVLRRDGTAVRVDADCRPTSGRWYSPYDGVTWDDPADVDIDHVVPLAEAWRSGASGWTQARRQAFANDLTNPQLITVTDNVNQAKSDQSPDQWKPPLTSYWCSYAREWIAVKHAWSLTVTSAEVAALDGMLDGC